MPRRKIPKIVINPNQVTQAKVNNRVVKVTTNRAIRPSEKQPINTSTKFAPRGSDAVFILGGGPSLRDMNLSFLDDKDVICVNKAIDLVKNPKYFITMDYSFFTKVGSSVRSIASRAQSSHFIINRQHSYIQDVGGVWTDVRNNFKYHGLEHFNSVISSFSATNNISGFGQTINEFCHGDNSGYCAIQFAILAGYKEIYLLGFDLTESKNRANTHFHKSYPDFSHDNFYKKINIYRSNLITSFEKIKKFNPVKISTLTPSSLESHIPLVPLTKFVRPKGEAPKPKPPIPVVTEDKNLDDLMIVAYYTVNTPYEAEAKKLIASLQKLGLNHDVVGVKNLGNWQANTRFKAHFMEDMLNKHPGKNLLYVDSDAIIHSRPILFNNYSCDIAVRWQDFRWRQNECLSGTIFMANNPKTRELCKRWQTVNISEGPNAKTFEQWNLGSVIKDMEKEGKIVTKNLPAEYTFIFDSMRKIYPNAVPVIEHFQASRKLRNKV